MPKVGRGGVVRASSAADGQGGVDDLGERGRCMVGGIARVTVVVGASLRLSAGVKTHQRGDVCPLQ